MKNKKNLLILILVLGIILTACNKNENTTTMTNDQVQEEVKEDVKESQAKKTIYVSNYPYYDLTKAIVGDKMDLVNITKNQDFHNWEPSAKDIADLKNADLFIYSGPGLEKWADDLIEKNLIGGSVLSLSDGLDLLKSTHSHDHDHHDHGEFDSHIWLSLKNAQVIIENIKDQVTELDPANADFYEVNYKDLSKKIKDLDDQYEETLKDKKRDEILVSHEAYGYLCRDYGFKQIGIEGINPQGEPSLKQIDNIIKLCREKDIKVIFYEESISPKVADLIANEVGASLELLSPIEVLSKEQLDAGKGYIEVMADNLKGLDKALNE